MQQAVKFGGGSVMVWGCISCDGVGPLAKIEGRMKGKDYIDLLSANLLPYMQSIGPECTFMDDNAPLPSSQCSVTMDVYQQSEAYGGVASTEPGFESY